MNGSWTVSGLNTHWDETGNEMSLLCDPWSGPGSWTKVIFFNECQKNGLGSCGSSAISLLSIKATAYAIFWEKLNYRVLQNSG